MSGSFMAFALYLHYKNGGNSHQAVQSIKRKSYKHKTFIL